MNKSDLLLVLTELTVWGGNTVGKQTRDSPERAAQECKSAQRRKRVRGF